MFIVLDSRAAGTDLHLALLDVHRSLQRLGLTSPGLSIEYRSRRETESCLLLPECFYAAWIN